MFKNDNKIMNEKNFGTGGRLIVAPTNEAKNEVTNKIMNEVACGTCVGAASSRPKICGKLKINGKLLASPTNERKYGTNNKKTQHSTPITQHPSGISLISLIITIIVIIILAAIVIFTRT